MDNMEREMLIREAKLRFPEVENFIIEMAVDAHIKNDGKEIIINDEEVQQEKNKMFKGYEYNPY